MAPELALAALEGIRPDSCVLDPMAGSGTVLRQASLAGHRAIGFDLDPLAVLVTGVCSRPVDLDAVESLYDDIEDEIRALRDDEIVLPWIDESDETTNFVSYWFGRKQQNALRRIAYVLRRSEMTATPSERRQVDVLKVALSRIIITKEKGASLARDVSHSRPHRVCRTSNYDVIGGFRKSTQQVLKFLEDGMPTIGARVAEGDARQMKSVKDSSVDLVVTSPPYLNAIDYLRGHKLSLVWLGYRVEHLRRVRSNSIGAEKSIESLPTNDTLSIESAMLGPSDPSRRLRHIVSRFAFDIHRLLGEIRRVLVEGGKAVFVVGDNCVQGLFISNSAGIRRAAEINGFRLESRETRETPSHQ